MVRLAAGQRQTRQAAMASQRCMNCWCPMDPPRPTAHYCYACDAMRTAVVESQYLHQVQEREEQERCAARKRMSLEGE